MTYRHPAESNVLTNCFMSRHRSALRRRCEWMLSQHCLVEHSNEREPSGVVVMQGGCCLQDRHCESKSKQIPRRRA